LAAITAPWPVFGGIWPFIFKQEGLVIRDSLRITVVNNNKDDQAQGHSVAMRNMYICCDVKFAKHLLVIKLLHRAIFIVKLSWQIH